MDTPLRLVLATQNPGKVDEIRALLSDLPVALRPATEIATAIEVVEDAGTLSGNAQKKAEAYHRHTGDPALADDTGLEVDALDGRPGVETARFAGPDATPTDNMRQLLEVMKHEHDRHARFRTVVCYVDGDGDPHTFEGVCEGSITRLPRGEGGFGYDPLFLPDGHSETFAEMAPNAKNAISHRKNALERFRTFLNNWLDPTD
jgi:XTP/dITP diphosphohydrolase